MKQITLSQITSSADAMLLAHHIVYDLHRPDYHPDDFFGTAAIDRLVDEAFEVCGDAVCGIFEEECFAYLNNSRMQINQWN